jgi:hypothetical protein
MQKGPHTYAKDFLTRSNAWCCRFFALYGAFLVKGKLPHTPLYPLVESSGWLGVSEALPSILGMKGPLCLVALSGQSPQPARGAPLGARG